VVSAILEYQWRVNETASCAFSSRTRLPINKDVLILGGYCAGSLLRDWHYNDCSNEMQSDRIGIEVDEEYCRIAASRLRDENQNLFSLAKLELPDFTATPEKVSIVREGAIHYSLTRRKTQRSREKR
jgi:hypothetical protein